MEGVPNRCDHADSTGAYALGALDAAEIDAVEAHLASCPTCQAELQELRAIVGLFPACPPTSLPRQNR